MTKLLNLFDQNPHVHAIMSAFADAGFDIRLVGGAVRNTLLDRAVETIDLVVDATPDEIEKTALDAGMSARLTRSPKGSVIVIRDKKFVEITPRQGGTLEDDAATRDFSVDKIYGSIDGTLAATHSALQDLAAGKVRLLGSPIPRLQENPARMLRFLRLSLEMSGRVDHESPEFVLCKTMAAEITSVDPKIIGRELRKMLGGAHPGEALAALAESRLLHFIFPSAPVGMSAHIAEQIDQLSCLRAAEITQSIETDFLHRLAIVSEENYLDHNFADTCAILALSRREAKEYKILIEVLNGRLSPAALGFFHGEEVGTPMHLMIEAASTRVATTAALKDVRRGASQKLPITFEDLPAGLEGAEIGAAFDKAKACWVQSDFTADRDKLLAAASL